MQELSIVNATAVTAISGTAAALNTLVGNEGDSGDKVNLDTDFTVQFQLVLPHGSLNAINDATTALVQLQM